MLAILAGAVLADLAVGDGRVALISALAAVVDRRVDDEPGRLAEEGLGTAALELADAGRGELSWASLDTIAGQQVPPVTADPAGVARGGAVAPVAARVHAPTAGAGLGAGLDLAALARDSLVATAGLEHPVRVAREAAAIVPAGASAIFELAAVARADPGGVGRWRGRWRGRFGRRACGGGGWDAVLRRSRFLVEAFWGGIRTNVEQTGGRRRTT